MHVSLRSLCLLAAAVGMGGVVWAQEEAAKPDAQPAAKPRRDFIRERFKVIDTDANGSISLAEFQTAQEKLREELKKRRGEKFDPSKLPNTEEVFKKADADANGELSLDEYRKSLLERRERMRGQGPRRDKGEGKPVKNQKPPEAAE